MDLYYLDRKFLWIADLEKKIISKMNREKEVSHKDLEWKE